MSRIIFTGIVLKLVLLSGITEATCCHEMKDYVENRTVAYNVLCSNNDRLRDCCRVIEEDIRKQTQAYRTLCLKHEIDHCKSNPCHPNASCVSSSGSFSCTCKTGFTGSGVECTDLSTATSCDALYKSGVRQDGVYIIHPDDLGPFKVRCDMTTDRGGWTVIQKRQDGSEDFYRGWSDYKKGFGDLNGEFWLGLDKIHRLSKSGQNTLRVDLMNFNGAERYAKYESFGVADGSDEYRLNISGYSGNAIDSFSEHNLMKFSTKDKDNDVSKSHCAALYKGGWWYKACYHSNLNGLYFGTDRLSVTGIVWFGWQGYAILKKTEVKIRPSQ